jgi:hypothetical protein
MRRPSKRAELRRLVADGADVSEIVARLRTPDETILALHFAGRSQRKIAKALGYKCHRSTAQHLRRPEVAYVAAQLLAAQMEAAIGDPRVRPLLLEAVTSATLDGWIRLWVRYRRRPRAGSYLG